MKQTPLITSLMNGSHDCSILLITNGADLSGQFEKKSVLMVSATVKYPKVHEELLRRGADPNFVNKQGSALHYAVEEDNDSLTNALISHGVVKIA